MRKDLFKVIVERPRSGGFTDGSSRRFRNDEERGGKIGMKRGYGNNKKWLNENLAPLERWLRSNIGRPWNKVYSEISANLDRRHTVQDHIFLHIGDFVERELTLIGGKLFQSESWNGRMIPLKEIRQPMYVDPRTGILRVNSGRLTRRQRYVAERAREKAELDARRRDIGDMLQLHKIDGCWYEIELEIIPYPVPQVAVKGTLQTFYPRVWDHVRKAYVGRVPNNCGDRTLYGKCWLYAKRKRQLSAAELRRHRLTNDNADFKVGVVAFGRRPRRARGHSVYSPIQFALPPQANC